MSEPTDERLRKVAQEMEDYFGSDARRIGHARRVAGFARTILETEKGDRELVLAAAYLHDIGIPEAERKYGSCAGELQELEGPPVAREILEKIGYPPPFVEEVCAIIGAHHSPGEIVTDNFHAIWDSDWLVNIQDDVEEARRAEVADRVMVTAAGKRLAGELFG